jgi:hypothetical protein
VEEAERDRRAEVYTTLDPVNQHAAQRAVNYMMPPPPSPLNPGRNAAAEVLIQPGTGRVRAMAIDRPYGSGKHRNTVNYAVGPQYHGGQGVQIGSTGKVYVMVTALEQGIPFGYSKNVGFSATVGGYTNCKGQPLPPGRCTTTRAKRAGTTPSTPGRPSPSTCGSPTWSRRSACAMWSAPPPRWA